MEWIYFNPLSANSTKKSNTIKQFVGFCGRIIWMCLISRQIERVRSFCGVGTYRVNTILHLLGLLSSTETVTIFNSVYIFMYRFLVLFDEQFLDVSLFFYLVFLKQIFMCYTYYHKFFRLSLPSHKIFVYFS